MADKDVAKKQNSEVATVDDTLAQFQGAGFEGMKSTDIAIPYITILQDLSPQVKRGERQIEGAQSGMLFNNVTEEMFEGEEKGILVIPCGYQKKWMEWKPRDSGGGLVRSHDTADILDECTRDEKGRYVTSEGNNIVETAYHYCLKVDMEKKDAEAIVIGMSSSNLKESRQWNYNMRRQQITTSDGKNLPAPMFAFMWRLRSKWVEKADNSWYMFDAEKEGKVEDTDLLNAAAGLYKSIMRGEAKVVGEDDGSPDDDIPF